MEREKRKEIKKNLGILMILVFFVFLYILIYGKLVRKEKNEVVKKINGDITIDFVVRHRFSFFEGIKIIHLKDVVITAYSNRVEETDNTPNIGASGRRVYEGCCAISQDLKGLIKFGDIVYVKKLDMFYVVEDVMNERHKNSLDIFFYKETKKPKIFEKAFKSDVIIIKEN